MSNQEKAEIVDFLMDVMVRTAEQNVDCCFDLDNPSGCCAMEVAPCCRTCNKPVIEAMDDPEPVAEYFCFGCNQLVAVSDALFCWACGVCVFPEDMHEQFNRLRKRRRHEQMRDCLVVKMPGRVLRFKSEKRGGKHG